MKRNSIFDPNILNCNIEIDVLQKVGGNAAIIYAKIREWERVIELSNIDSISFSSNQDVYDKLPFFTYDQIRRSIEKLKKNKLLIEEKIIQNNSKERVVLRTKVFGRYAKCLADMPSKEKPSPHTPYKKKDKVEYILSSESDNKLSSSSDNNIQSFNNFSFVSSTRAREEEKEKKERFPIFEKDVFEEFLTNTIYREVVMKSYGIDEKTLDYCINQARKKSSCMIDGVTRREAQFKVKYELDNIPVVKGKLFDRKQAFYNEILNCANQQNLDRDFATWFYCKWSHLAIPELEIMMFEKEAKDKSWDTFRMLKMSYLSYKRKNEKYY